MTSSGGRENRAFPHFLPSLLFNSTAKTPRREGDGDGGEVVGGVICGRGGGDEGVPTLTVAEEEEEEEEEEEKEDDEELWEEEEGKQLFFRAAEGDDDGDENDDEQCILKLMRGKTTY